MSNSLANTNNIFLLKIHSGKNEGQKYEIISSTVTMGRSQSNDIIIDDPKCSRSHIKIQITKEAALIINISDGNQMLVNGTQQIQAFAADDSIFQIGDTKFSVTRNQHFEKIDIDHDLESFNLNSTVASKIPKRYIYYALGFLGLIGVLLSQDTETNKISSEIDISSTEDKEAAIQTIKEHQNRIIASRARIGKNSKEFLQAQSLYLQGFRDYREERYKRALSYFNGALSIYPKHELARRYQSKTRKKINSTIQETLLEANRFLKQQKYKSAASAYKNVLILIDDPSNKIFKEAQARYRECQLLIREAYQ